MKRVPVGWLAWDAAAGDLSGQVYHGLRERILAGELPSGAALPSSRALAASLGVARSTVILAYERLRLEGYTSATPGAPTRVAALPAAIPPPSRPTPPAPPAPPRYGRGEFEPGVPDLAAFPHAAWAQCLGARARSLRLHDLGYGAWCGLPELREAVLAHLVAQRGVAASAEQVLILPSTGAALLLLARLQLRPERRVAWIEDPGYLPARRAFAAAGADLVPLPVDADGADVAGGRGTPALIYVTPSHQYPTGVTMSLPRRLALLEAARRAGALVLEDDYDSEFLAGPPIAALQSIDRAGVVAYLGTFSKVLAPGLRTAYAIVPAQLAAPAAAAQASAGLSVPIHVQAALADFLREGRLRAHVRRMAPVYRDNAARLAQALERRCGRVSLGPARGLQLAAWFRDRAVDDVAIAIRLAAEGFGPDPLSIHALADPRSGLLFGTARVAPGRSEALADRLASHLEAA